MKRSISTLSAIAFFMSASVPVASFADTTRVWTGTVKHVSTDNIKVYSWKEHKALSFLLMPHFKQVFSSDGKTTSQMAKIREGMIVKVYYDQHALGIRHADRILVIGGNDVGAMNIKS